MKRSLAFACAAACPFLWEHVHAQATNGKDGHVSVQEIIAQPLLLSISISISSAAVCLSLQCIRRDCDSTHATPAGHVHGRVLSPERFCRGHDLGRRSLCRRHAKSLKGMLHGHFPRQSTLLLLLLLLLLRFDGWIWLARRARACALAVLCI